MTRLISTFDGPWAHVSQVPRFASHDILHVYDAFDQDHLQNLFLEKGYPGHVFQDSYTFYQGDIPVKFWCADLWLGTEILKFQDLNPRPIDTKYAVNFIVNKKQINRFLAIKLVEFFNLSCTYTWSGLGRNFDMSSIIKELETLGDGNPWTDDIKKHFLEPIVIEPKWIPSPNEFQHGTSAIQYIVGNRWTWNNGIGDIMSSAAVSLIAESQRFEKAIHFSEKTMYAMLAQTLPIWIGGFRQADEWQNFGFDTFKDVINHDYQYRDTLVERCWYAIFDNIDLLCNLDELRKIRLKLGPRLHKNLCKIKENVVQQRNQEIIKSWPEEIKREIKPIIDYLFPNHVIE